MANERIDSPTILIGFMGAGKSTSGPEAARRLGVPFRDTDEWMEAHGVDVPGLVKSNMEQFRQVEVHALEEVLAMGPGVISTGGGITTTEHGLEVLHHADWRLRAKIVWMWAPFTVHAERVAQDTGRERPLFRDERVAGQLYRNRLGSYAAAATHAIYVGGDVDDVAEQIAVIARTGRYRQPVTQ